jgi:hypothetical protein
LSLKKRETEDSKHSKKHAHILSTGTLPFQRLAHPRLSIVQFAGHQRIKKSAQTRTFIGDLAIFPSVPTGDLTK